MSKADPIKPADFSHGESYERRTRVDVTYTAGNGERRTVRFGRGFRIGRSQNCELQLADELVSREHLQIYWKEGQWWIQDLGSLNGTYLNNVLIHELPLTNKMTLELGSGGASIQLQVVGSDPYVAQDAPSPADAEFDIKFRKQARRYRLTIGLTLLLLIGVSLTAASYYLKIKKADEQAVRMFYAMKGLELEMADLEDKINNNVSKELVSDLQIKRQALDRLRAQYQVYVESIGTVERRATDDVDRLIFYTARRFGECEVNMPSDFVTEVKRYIARWQATSRYPNAVRALKEKGYAPIIYHELEARQLPPEFIYLALQESNYDERTIGPPTRYGRAKGMWQFIAATGSQYGLKIGPLKDTEQYDPVDERHHPLKSTIAAAKYLKYIYKTDAQASGLLVMASYNWGEGNVINRIRSMPLNPEDRNFWKLIASYEIPQETYDYVLYIFSAAVIGQNPKLFGFNFDNPLQGLDETK